LSYFLLQILNALSFSALLMLAGLGLSLVLSLMNFINLTHGSFFLLGGYISVQWLASGAPWWLAFPAAFALCGLMGLLLDRFPFRQFYQRTHLMQVLLTYGLSVILADLMRWGFSADTLSPMLPQVLRGGVWIMGLPFPTYRLFLIVTGLTLALLFWFLLDRTLWGAAIRACVQDAQIVETLGLNSRRLFAIGMALAAGLAGFPGLDEEILLLALLVVVIGGLNSVRGTLLCALILGFVTTFARVWVPAFANAATLAVMLGLLLCWPNGLSKSATRQV